MEEEINDITLNDYLITGVVVLLIVFGVIIFRNYFKKTEHLKENNHQNYKDKILNYLKSIEQDYYWDYLTNYLSMTFDIDEYNEEFRYQVKNINSLLELKVKGENLNASNRFMNELCYRTTGKEGEKTPDLTLSFLVQIYRIRGRLKALKHIGTKYEVQKNFPEQYIEIENELNGTRQKIIDNF